MASSPSRGVVEPRLDLGVRALAPEWRALLPKGERASTMAQGLVLAAQMLPFTLFLGVISGIPASGALASAAVGSAVCVFLGGTHTALAGPGLATALLVSSIVHDHGIRSLGAAMLAMGLGQLAVGVLGLGRLVRLLPLSVTRGYVLGMGVLLLAAQLPLAIGAHVADGASPLEQLDRIGMALADLDGAVLLIAAASALVTGVSHRHPKIPGAMIAITGAAVAVALLKLEVPTLAESGRLTLVPSLPEGPSRGVASLLGKLLALFLTATIATTVSTISLERMTGRRQDPDQELIANGIATVVLAFVGGVPTTQLIARSAAAVRAGIERRGAALVQAVVVLAAAAAVVPVLRFVPVASLVGIAIALGAPLLDPKPLRELGRISRFELGVAIASVTTIALVGLVEGMLLGLGIALVAATTRLARTRALVQLSRDPGVAHQVSFSGPITFLASLELEALRSRLANLDVTPGIVVDLRSVLAVDATGAAGLVAALDDTRARGGKVALLGPSATVTARLLRADEELRDAGGVEPGTLAGAVAATDLAVDAILGRNRSGGFARSHLLAGLARFREEMREHYDSLFAHLADGQHPHTMFITCADSRVQPALLMGAHPGDLFIVRSIGALVPPAAFGAMPQEGAAIEYGVGVLGIRDLVLCGHSKCGAIGALKKGKVPPELETLAAWSRYANDVAGDLSGFTDADEATRAVMVRQLENLKSYPLVREKIEKGELQVHAWFYDLGAVELFEWDERRGEYAVLGAEPRLTLPPPVPDAASASPEEDATEATSPGAIS